MRGSSAPAAPVEVLSDGDDAPTAPDEEFFIESVRRLTADELRRRKMDAARAAMRRAAEAPRRPHTETALLCTYRCPICLGAPTNLCVTPCGHMFCGACLHDAIAAHPNGERAETWAGALDEAQAAAAHLFTPLGSGAAFALANAAGAPVRSARDAYQELRQQRQSAPTASPTAEAPGPSTTRLRATNGTERLKGLCPVCRSPIRGGFTGLGKRGISGLELCIGTPRAPSPPPSDAEARPTKRSRAQP